MQQLRAEAVSERQRQILDGIAAGKSNGVLADEMGITVDGVKWHVSEMLWDTGCTDRYELADWWRRERPKTSAQHALWAFARPSRHFAVSTLRVGFMCALTAAIVAGIYLAATHGSSRNAAVGGQDAAGSSLQGTIAYVRDGEVWTKTLPDAAPQQLTHDGKAKETQRGTIDRVSWSPSGAWLAVIREKGITIMRADGSDARDASFSSWMPASDQYLGGAGDGSIEVVDPAAGSHRTIIPLPAAPAGMRSSITSFVPSPSGAFVAYTVLDSANSGSPPARHVSLWRVDIDGKGAEKLYDGGTPSKDGIAVTGWAPDGARVLVSIDPFFSASALADGVPLQVVGAGGGTLEPLVDAVLLPPQAQQAFSGHGSLIAVGAGSGRETWTNKRVEVMDMHTGATSNVTDTATAATAPALSSDGQRVAYVAMPDAGSGISGGEPAKAALAQRKVWVMDADGSNKRQLTSDSSYRDEYPQWSADGKQIMFARLDAHDAWSLWSAPAAGGMPHELVAAIDDASTAGTPAWFGYYGAITFPLDWWQPQPSSLGRLAYTQDGDIWTKTLPDGTPLRITHYQDDPPAPGPYSAPAWSPSGAWLTYTRENQPGVMRADGTGARALPGTPVWSPVADRLAYANGGGDVIVENADGSEQTAATPQRNTGGADEVSPPIWNRDGTVLAYVEQRAAPAPLGPYDGVWMVAADGGAPPIEIYSDPSAASESLVLIKWVGPDILVQRLTGAALAEDGGTFEVLRAQPDAHPQFTTIAPRNPAGMAYAPFVSAVRGSTVLVTDGLGRDAWTNKRIGLLAAVTGVFYDITEPSITATEPAFSPDGQQIAYVAMPDEGDRLAGNDGVRAALSQRKIWVMDTQTGGDLGTNKRALTSDSAYRDEYPQWSADGREILFVRLDADDHASLWLASAAGGAPHEVVDDWSPVVLHTLQPWFGAFGHLAWDTQMSWWQPVG